MSGLEPLARTVPALAAGGDAADTSAGESFLRRPFVQNILPFLTSLSVHAGIVALGLVAFTAITIVRHPAPMQDQVAEATTEIQPNPGMPKLAGDMNSLHIPPMQNEAPSETTGSSFDQARIPALAGGAPGEDPGNTFDFGPHQGMTSGSGGARRGVGPGNGQGMLEMFGHPQNGGGQGTVFITSRGARRIAFVCDASGSMINKMASLKLELQNAVGALKPIQSFSIIFFQDTRRPDMLSDSLLPATPETKRKAGTFLEGVTTTGTTDPIPGIEAAFRQQPELIYLLTDGDFPDNAAVLSRVRVLNKEHKVKINTIAFVGTSDNDTGFIDLLKTVATENGGTYKHVDEGSLGN